MTTITTPAGETIEVVSDADFMEVYDVRGPDLRIWNPKQPLLAALWFDGTMRSANGRATTALWERAVVYGYPHAQTGTASLLQTNSMRGCIERELNGKRTYSIKLARLPQTWADKLAKLKRHGQSPAQADRKEVQQPPEPVTAAQPVPVAEPASDATEDVAAAVARELLAEVVRIINAPPPEPVISGDLVDARDRLSKSLEYSQKLRRELQETGDELKAVKQERDMLRQRLHIAEANMDKALGDGRRFVDAEVQKALGRIMSAKPTTKGDDE
jgi:hypothetical protein